MVDLRTGCGTSSSRSTVKVFDNRPFLWHIWDGRKDGFSAFVNYHRLDHERWRSSPSPSLGSMDRAAAARGRREAGPVPMRVSRRRWTCRSKLKLILDGEPPYDVYVRWKELHEQPIGWDPDLDDGVRLNIRPFVTAGVLRSKVNVHWKKDRGTNPDGSERINDLHPTLEERRERPAAGRSEQPMTAVRAVVAHALREAAQVQRGCQHRRRQPCSGPTRTGLGSR